MFHFFVDLYNLWLELSSLRARFFSEMIPWKGLKLSQEQLAQQLSSAPPRFPISHVVTENLAKLASFALQAPVGEDIFSTESREFLRMPKSNYQISNCGANCNCVLLSRCTLLYCTTVGFLNISTLVFVLPYRDLWAEIVKVSQHHF